MRDRRLALTLLAILISTPLPIQSVHAEVVHGYANLLSTYIEGYGGSDDGFDFATQTVVSWSTSETADLSFNLNVFYEDPVIALKNCLGAAADVSLEELSEAPESLTPLGGAGVHLNQTIVVKTGDNLYVKFAARSLPGYGIEIEYYVRTDGSRSFGPLLPVKPSTWGQVKALYR